MSIATKIAALDRLASCPAAAPTERANAANAAAALRRRETAALGALVDLALSVARPSRPPAAPTRDAAQPPAPVVPNAQPRCAAYLLETGARCHRKPLRGGERCRWCRARQRAALGQKGA